MGFLDRYFDSQTQYQQHQAQKGVPQYSGAPVTQPVTQPVSSPSQAAQQPGLQGGAPSQGEVDLQNLTASEIGQLYATGEWQQMYQQQSAMTKKIRDDFAALQNKDYDEITDWRALASAAMHSSLSGDAEYEEFGQSIFHELRDHAEFRDMVDLLDPDRNFEDFYIPPEEPGTLKKGFGKVMEFIARPGEWGIGLLADLNDQEFQSFWNRLGSGTLEVLDTVAGVANIAPGDLGDRFDELTDKITDRPEMRVRDISHLDTDESGSVGFREALGLPSDWGENVIPGSPIQPGHIFELGGQIAADPTTYVTAGAGGVTGRGASRGLNSLEDLLYASSTRTATPLLDDASRGQLTKVVAGLKSGKRWKDIPEANEEQVKTWLQQAANLHKGDSLSGMAPKLTDKQLGAIDNTAKYMRQRAGGGVFFAGVPIPGTRQIAQGLRNSGITGSKFTPVEDVAGRAGSYSEVVSSKIDDVGDLAQQADDVAKQGTAVVVGPEAPRFGGFTEDISLLRNARQQIAPRIRAAFNPMVQITDQFGAGANRMYRNLAGMHVSNTAREVAEFQRAVVRNTDKAVDVIKRSKGWDKRTSQEFLSETIDRIRSVPPGKERGEMLGRLRAEGMGDVAELVNMIDAHMLRKFRHEVEMGALTGDLARQKSYIAGVRNNQGVGAKGKHTKNLQEMLNDRFNAGLKADGQFGKKTKEALIDVQNRLGLEGTGYYSASTAKAINEHKIASAMQHRAVDMDTEKMVSRWFRDDTEEARWLRQNMAKPSDDFMDYMVSQGMVSPEDARMGVMRLFNKWTGEIDEIAKRQLRGPASEADDLQALFVGRGEVQERSLFKDLRSVNDVNEAIANIMKDAVDNQGAPDGLLSLTKFYNTDPVDAVIRMANGHSQAKLQFDMLSDLSEVAWPDVRGTGQMVHPVVKGQVKNILGELEDGSRGVVRRTYEWFDQATNRTRNVDIPLDAGPDELLELYTGRYKMVPVGQNLWLVDQDVMKEMDTLLRTIKGGPAIDSEVYRFFAQWNAIWAAHATVPLVGTGFHARNAQGNWINMAMGGFRNPNRMMDASWLQKMNKDVRKHMEHGAFADWDDAAKDLIKRGGLSDEQIRQIDQLKLARDNGILSTSFFSDLKTDASLFDPRSQAWMERAKAKGIDNPFVRSGQAVGATIENNARLAMFLDALDKGMNPRNASEHVKKYLFDYSDLTPFENHAVKVVSRFYTWMRKNTALQFRMLASQPGSIVNAQRITDYIMASLWGEDDPAGMFIPEWAQNDGLMFSADRAILHGYETPFSSAMDVVDKVGSLALILPGGDKVLPKWMGEGDFQRNMRASLGLLASGPTSLATAIAESSTGVDMFTGATFNDSGYAKTMLFFDSIMPSVSKTTRLLEQMQILEAGDDETWGLVSQHQEDEGLFDGPRLISLFLGNRVYRLNEEQQLRALGAIAEEYDEMIAEIAAGRSPDDPLRRPPTRRELEQAGKIGRMNELHHALYLAKDKDAAIVDLFPKGELQDIVAAELGVPVSVIEDRERTREEWIDDQKILLRAFEMAAGRPLTAKEQIELAMSWESRPYNKVLEQYGIAGEYDPILLQSPTTRADREARNRAMVDAWLADMRALDIDLSLEEIAQIRQNQDFFTRLHMDGLEQGYTEDEIRQNILENMGRSRQAAFYGVQALEEYDYNKSYDEYELADLSRNVQWDIAQANKLMELEFGRGLTWEEAELYVLHGGQRLTKTAHRALLEDGYDLPPVAEAYPQRKDPRSDAEKLQDYRNQYDAIQRGIGDWFGQSQQTAGPQPIADNPLQAPPPSLLPPGFPNPNG